MVAHRAAGADGDRGWVLLQRVDEILEGLETAVGAHGEHAVIRAYRTQPAHVVFGEAAELALRQVHPGPRGYRHDHVRIVTPRRLDLVVGHGADATRQVGGADRRLDDAKLVQLLRGQPTGQVEPAPGRRRSDAFGVGRLEILRQRQRGAA